MGASTVLERMARVYARAETYSDRGVVMTWFGRPEGAADERRSFQTAFRRPHGFRFEFSDDKHGDSLVIWQESPPAKRRFKTDDIEETVDLVMALAAATGISGGSAWTIPRLLMPELGEGWALTDLENPSESEPQAVEGIDCLCIQGQRQGSSMTVWIGAGDLLLRKIRQTIRFGPEEYAELLATVPPDLRESAEAMLPEAQFQAQTETLYFPIKDPVLSPADFSCPPP